MTATATAPAPVAAAPEPGARGKKSLVMIVVAVLVLAGAGYFFLLRSSGDAAAHEPVPGPVVDLEPLTLNLADGRFLKVGLSLQTSADAAGGHGSEELNGAKARDAAIGIFGQRTYAQLLSPKGREVARKALDTEVKHRYEGEVLKVYLTEFVMQ
jgi:flagellar protein FliL